MAECSCSGRDLSELHDLFHMVSVINTLLLKINVMEDNAAKIISNQKETWDKFSSAWAKWGEIALRHKDYITDEMIKMLELGESDTVLDIASGTGEPSLSIARKTKGMVTATDLSQGMLTIAKDKAEKAGIKNFTTVIAGVDELPFGDSEFDRVVCRFGFMFFPDMSRSLNEMLRVLKPGGRIVAAVWNVPKKNFWVTAMTEAMKKHIELPPPPPPDMPGMFRCSEKDFMKNMFEKAGLKNVVETEINGHDEFEEYETYWSINTEMSIPVVMALKDTDDATRTKIKEELYDIFRNRFGNEKVRLESSAIVVAGDKKNDAR